MKKKIELYLISGFLGAGKTTFLKKLLNSLEGKKVGVIVNEFGAVGIDGKTVERRGLTLKEINNGSIFCSCLKATFVKTLVAFDREDIDVLLIENSGFADPVGMHSLMKGLEKLLSRGYDYRGSVCVVDGTAFLDVVDVLAPVENQVLSSNFILVNKADLAEPDELEAVESKIRELNPDAVLFRTVQADIPLNLLDVELRDNGIEGDTTNCPASRPAAYTVLTRLAAYDKAPFEAFLREMASCALRVKGFVKTHEGIMHVDAVRGAVSVTPADQTEARVEPQRMALVLIGYGAEPFKDELKAVWKKHLKDNPILLR